MFKTSRYFGLKTACALALLLVLGFVAEAFGGVKVYQMTGTWQPQRGTAGIPLQFIFTKTKTPSGAVEPTAVGKHNFPIAFPNGPVKGSGQVKAPGSGPAGLTLPVSIFSSSASIAPPGFQLPGPFNIQITTDFSKIRAPGPMTAVTSMGGGGLGGISAVLAAGGGPGAVTFCPKAGFNVSIGVSAASCPSNPGNPPQGTGPRNGRVLITPGANTFGGTMQMFLGGSGLVTRTRVGFGFGDATFQAFHNTFGGGGGMLQNQGGAMVGTMTWANDANDLPGGPYTQPLVIPTATNKQILVGNAGPKITTSGKFTACPTMFGTNLTMCTAADVGTMTTLLTPGVATTNNTGFPFTTGLVLAQQSTNTGGGIDNFTLQGSDARTPKGVGQITLVAGGLSIRKTAATLFSTGSAETVVMTMSQKVPTMSKTGFAAAAALMVLAVGYAFRRRF